MKYNWIENYAGTWQDDEGRKLIIKINNNVEATVDLLINEVPMIMPWCNNKPAKGLHAIYDPVWGPGLDIELERPGFTLYLNYEFSDVINPDTLEELSVAISWYEADKNTEKFIKMFGKLGRYRKADGDLIP